MSSRKITGLVGPDGKSALPAGIVDHAEGADDVAVSEEVQKRLDQIFKDGNLDNLKARYKLELCVHADARSTIKPYFGIVTAWTNGGFNSGGGDEVVYFCPVILDKDGQSRTCSSPIDLKWIGKSAAICPTCRNAFKPDDLCGQVGFRFTTQNWAAVIARMWVGLGGDADIRLGIMRGRIRERTDDIMMRTSLKAGDKLDELREKREWAIYPLRNIMKDINAGAALQARILHFISS
jgi:hypothetical protein